MRACTRTTTTCSKPPRTTCGCTSPATRATTARTCRSSSRARVPTSGMPTASATSTGWPACSSASWVTGAPNWPRQPRSRPRSWRSCRCGPTRTRARSSSPSRIAGYAPGDLNRVFFTSGGGEAVETAWKLAKNYFKLVGKPMKHKVISRAIAYHGTTQGALSITGLPLLKQQFEPLVPSTFRVPNTNIYRAPIHGDDPEAFGRWAADQIAVAIENEGADTVAAVFLEPVQNAGGCFPPPPGYFQRVREICDEYDVLLVSDEVICAFGRLGHMFGAERYGYEPDIITCAKGITSGYAPLGAMIATDRLMEPFLTNGEMFAHGYTFGGHPVSTAVALRQPRHLRGREDPRQRPRQRGRLPGHPRAPQGPPDRRRRPRRRLLLRHRAGQGQGDQGDLHRRGVRTPALRLRLQAALRRGPLLPRRRPRRPRRPDRPAADLHPGALRRDRAHPAGRARQGVLDGLSRCEATDPTGTSRRRRLAAGTIRLTSFGPGASLSAGA